MTLTEFLLARIAEDEANHEMAKTSWPTPSRPGPGRGEREVAAKRRLLEWLGAGELTADADAGYAVRVMAEPYADHPDYRDEWRP